MTSVNLSEDLPTFSKQQAEPKVGELAEGRGVYVGKYAGLAAYAAPDFLRDETGRQLVLNFDEARDELTRRNGGKAYGDGTEMALCQAIENNTYRDGDLVLPPQELLSGRNVDEGDRVRAGENVYDLLDKPALNKVKATISNGEGAQCWALSGSEHPDDTLIVSHVRLTDGDDNWFRKDGSRSGVVPVRLYKPAHTLGG